MKKCLLYFIIFVLGLVIGAFFSDYAGLLRVHFYSGKDKYEFIESMKTDVYKLLPERVRLEYLLNHKILIFRVPEGNECILKEAENFEFFKEGNGEILKKHRREVIPVLLDRLKKLDHSVSLVLGYLKAKEALPLLRRSFIKDSYFYGWEGSKITDENNYTHHYCYEEAIEYITGKPIEKYIKLTKEEIRDLRKRKAKGEEAAAYVLYRLVGEPWDKMALGRGKNSGAQVKKALGSRQYAV